MPITDQERVLINELLNKINHKINTIMNARDDVVALLRIHVDINSDTVEDKVLSESKKRALIASQELVTLLSWKL